MTERAVRLHGDDDVAVAKTDLAKGDVVVTADTRLVLTADIGAGHKFAVRSVSNGDRVLKYGQTIGMATCEIQAGDHVHVHNMGMGTERSDYEFGTDLRDPAPPAGPRITFEGYLRADGRVGTRNYVAVIATANCAASVVRRIADEATDRLLPDCPHVDGVIGLTHKSGCAAPLGGEDYRLLQRTIAGYAFHPNVAAALLVGLGCEGNQAEVLLDDTAQHRLPVQARPAVLGIQNSGGTGRAIGDGLELVASMLREADTARRTTQPLSALTVALQCGGSDGASGITANPALGIAADRLVSHGGTAILGETPEVYGAEHLLTRRAVSPEVGQRLLGRIEWWKRYAGAWGADMDSNPAPGNKEGGLTTIFEKSLGAVSKGGSTPLRAVYDYAERVSEHGLVFMDTPGYDPVSVTGMVAGGASLVCFTTGRGSCYGCVPSPSLKIASNSALHARMEDDVDVDAGVALGGATVGSVAESIFATLVDAASGVQTKSEALGLGEEEFAPWVLGPVM